MKHKNILTKFMLLALLAGLTSGNTAFAEAKNKKCTITLPKEAITVEVGGVYQFGDLKIRVDSERLHGGWFYTVNGERWTRLNKYSWVRGLSVTLKAPQIIRDTNYYAFEEASEIKQDGAYQVITNVALEPTPMLPPLPISICGNIYRFSWYGEYSEHQIEFSKTGLLRITSDEGF